MCTPGKASMFTGKHLPGHWVYRLHDVLPDDEVCFTERLRPTGDLVEWMFGQEAKHGARGGEAVPGPKQRIVNTLS